MGKPDPRTNAYRSDLASQALKGKVDADRYVKGDLRRVAAALAPVRQRPDALAAMDTEAFHGETVRVFDVADDWAWVQLERDGYVGYMPNASLVEDLAAPTHRLVALGSFVYPEPDIKTPPLMQLPLNALVRVVDESDRFARLATGGHVIRRHLATIERVARDFVDVAEQFLGTPYLWGGRTRLGIDCSGLVQTSLEAAGIACPRDSDMQKATLGMEVLVPQDLEGLQRGDLVFWQGHVAIMSDGIMLLHANAHHMSTVIEPLHEAASRIAKTGGPITTVRRLPSLTGREV
ncbi:MAG: C40 family peptidase [Hyphomicrobiaceae bacterium]|nr:C40 family peptidase [Hyphomicrobiaceae bacterium]